MDPLSFSASLIAIITISGKLTSTLSTLISDGKDTPSEFPEIRDEIISLTWVLERLHTLVREELDQEHKLLQHPSSTFSSASTLQSTPKLGCEKTSLVGTTDIHIAIKSCAKIMQELDSKVTIIESWMKGGIWEKTKYTVLISLERTALRDIRVRLNHARVGILVSLNVRTL